MQEAWLDACQAGSRRLLTIFRSPELTNVINKQFFPLLYPNNTMRSHRAQFTLFLDVSRGWGRT